MRPLNPGLGEYGFPLGFIVTEGPPEVMETFTSRVPPKIPRTNAQNHGAIEERDEHISEEMVQRQIEAWVEEARRRTMDARVNVDGDRKIARV
jgi:hypothetical protein